jgi:hypothetical protein
MSDWLHKLHGEALGAPVRSFRFKVIRVLASSRLGVSHPFRVKQLGTRVTRPSNDYESEASSKAPIGIQCYSTLINVIHASFDFLWM